MAGTEVNRSRSYLYGSGVFTTIRIIDGEPWLWDKHWRRLMHDADRLGIDTSPYSEYMVRRGLDESISDADKLNPQKARITVTDLRSSRLWTDDEPTIKANVEFLVSPLRVVPRPFRLGVSPYLVNSTTPLAGLKTCNYLEQTMSIEEARARGFHETIRINERGIVTSACMANVFWLKGETLFTPSVATGCLPGTTREFVIETLDVSEVEAEISALQAADAIFLTSAGLGVVQVDDLAGREMPRVDHPMLRLAASEE